MNAVAWQPFTSNVCSASGDKTVSVWDARTGLCVQTLYGHSNSVNNLVVSNRGDMIVSSDADGVVKVWDVRMVAELGTIDAGQHPINKVGAYSNAFESAIHGVSFVNICTITGMHLLHAASFLHPFPPTPNCALLYVSLPFPSALDRGGLKAVAASDDSTIKVIDLQTFTVVNSIPGGYI